MFFNKKNRNPGKALVATFEQLRPVEHLLHHPVKQKVIFLHIRSTLASVS